MAGAWKEGRCISSSTAMPNFLFCCPDGVQEQLPATWVACPRASMARDPADASARGRAKGRAEGRALLPLAVLAVVLVSGPTEAGGSALPSLPALRGLRRDTAPYKGFSGIRVRGDSARKVFYHDQTIAVVEASMDYNAERDLQNCELIEVKYVLFLVVENCLRAVPMNRASAPTVPSTMGAWRCGRLWPLRGVRAC